MKKNSKAFTLIELLAIIVILAIIALITMPIILNIIENSRKGAAIDSAYGFKDSINKYFLSKLSEQSNYNFTNGEYTISKDSNGVKITLKDSTTDYHIIPVSGTVPNGGWIEIEKNAVTNGQVQIGEYCVSILNGNIGEAAKNECSLVAEESLENQQSDDNWFTYSQDGKTITGFSEEWQNYSGELDKNQIVIPRRHNDIEITAIGDDAFSNSSLTSVKMLDNIIYIGNSAFYYYENYITIPV